MTVEEHTAADLEVGTVVQMGGMLEHIVLLVKYIIVMAAGDVQPRRLGSYLVALILK
jgi:hypothetical protein